MMLFISIICSLFSVVSNTESNAIFKQFTRDGTNTYIIGQNKEVAIIDAGVCANEMLAFVKKENLSVKYIILTHGHSDHMEQVPFLKSQLKTKLAMHKNDVVALWYIKMKNPDKVLINGDTLYVGGLKLEIIHTPGHTQGGICIKAGNKLFSGDTLFYGTIGSSDNKGGDYNTLISSIKNILMKMDDGITVFPGHGGSTTIGFERNNNPFLK